MRKLIFAALALIAIACSQNEEPTLLPDSDVAATSTILDSEPGPDSIKVNVFEALRMASSELSPVSATSRSASVTIDSVLSAEGKAVLYILNFGENGGFLITSAVKTAAPVIAFNDRGHFDLANINPNAKFGLDIITHNVENTLTLPQDSTFENRLLWSLVENREAPSISRSAPENGEDFDSWPESLKQQFYDSQAVMRDSISSWNFRNYYSLDGETNSLAMYLSSTGQNKVSADEVLGAARNCCYWQFETNFKRLSVLRYYIAEERRSGIPNMIESLWEQNNGYNMSYPIIQFIDGVDHVYAGCVAVAMGQIMRYYQWPKKYDWSKMPHTYATKTTSDFLYELAELSNATYSEEGTGITAEAAKNTYQTLGYSTSGINIANSILSVDGEIVKGCPVNIFAISKPDSNGQTFAHSFIACGDFSLLSRDALALYTVTSPGVFRRVDQWSISYSTYSAVYINWGYGGKDDGYFSNSLLVNGKDYNNILYYITPIPNK